MKNILNRLEKIPLRHVWTNESGEFTPWLAQEENLKLLSDTIGIELGLVAQEKSVGSFFADIVCESMVDETKVLIENQLEKTDHTHLGQLLTYAAGLDAVTIIWIAAHINDEHRAALDWLNEITSEHFNFFGLEIELWRIGESDIAPKFNVVVQPNDWTKIVTGGFTKNLTDDKQLQLDFWTAFKIHILEREANVRPQQPRARHWMSFALGRSGIHLEAIASFWDSDSNSYSANELRAEVYLKGEQAKDRFLTLEKEKAEIEQEMGEKLSWYNPLDSKMCRIYLRKSVDLRDREQWPNHHHWLFEKLEKLYTVFRPRIRDL
jgi:hypothetical protein